MRLWFGTGGLFRWVEPWGSDGSPDFGTEPKFLTRVLDFSLVSRAEVWDPDLRPFRSGDPVRKCTGIKNQPISSSRTLPAVRICRACGGALDLDHPPSVCVLSCGTSGGDSPIAIFFLFRFWSF